MARIERLQSGVVVVKLDGTVEPPPPPKPPKPARPKPTREHIHTCQDCGHWVVLLPAGEENSATGTKMGRCPACRAFYQARYTTGGIVLTEHPAALREEPRKTEEPTWWIQGLYCRPCSGWAEVFDSDGGLLVRCRWGPCDYVGRLDRDVCFICRTVKPADGRCYCPQGEVKDGG